jgi:hypothetical protein
VVMRRMLGGFGRISVPFESSLGELPHISRRACAMSRSVIFCPRHNPRSEVCGAGSVIGTILVLIFGTLSNTNLDPFYDVHYTPTAGCGQFDSPSGVMAFPISIGCWFWRRALIA